MKLKVLQLCKYYSPILGGIELVEKTITSVHADLQDETFIVSFGNEDKECIGDFGEKILQIKQNVIINSAPVNYRFIFQFKKIILKKQINRIYVHLPNPFMHEVMRQSEKFLKKYKVEVIAIYHSDIVNQKFLGKIYDIYFSLSKSVYDYWICSSQKLWDSSPILCSINLNKKRIIPFCTEGKLTYLPREKFKGKLLAVGRLVPYKGFDFLITTINKTKYELNIIGDGPEFDKLKNIAGPNIILHRKLNDLDKNNLFSSCDALIVSSVNRAEAYGMIIVEAFEAGLPVIASNLDSGVTFLVQNELTGLVFDVKNEHKLIESIERLENDCELYLKISRNTKKFYDDELSYTHFRSKINSI